MGTMAQTPSSGGPDSFGARGSLSVGDARATILDKLEQFLARHSKSEDLGLRLDGEQLAAGDAIRLRGAQSFAITGDAGPPAGGVATMPVWG